MCIGGGRKPPAVEARQAMTKVGKRYSIPIAADAPPGQYHIELGMYGLVDGARLPVLANDAVVGDHVLLPPIEIKVK